MRATFLYSSAIPSMGVKEPAIAVRIAQAWLALGCLALSCLPALRGRSEWIGWLPLWLVVVPAAQLLILRWRALFAASHSAWARLHRRRAKPASRRAHRSRKPAVRRRARAESPGSALLAALLLR